MSTPPRLSVKPLDAVAFDSWHWIDAVFANAPAVESQQAWLVEPEPGFRPLRVKTGWTREALYVYAELEDADIFNPEKRFNEPSFMSGDVFEIFLRPCSQESYVEIHVTPENQKFQLRIPSAREFAEPRAKPGIPQEWFIDRVIESRVRVNPAAQRWEVAVEIPFAMVCEVFLPRTGDRWLFSFSRYDYTRGREKPVLSSTSPHQVLNFHRQEEWGELRFTG
ncbi:MAG: carbohydrate-binding family 9-like protein [bacterium]